jgi:hypothetical protein
MPAEELLSLITPRDACSYALAHGWQRIPNKRPDIAVFELPESGTRKQLVVPLEPSFDGYATLMGELVAKLAEVENRPARSVLEDLRAPNMDVLRYRIDSPDAARGTLPVVEAVALFEGVEMSLLAAAHSVLSPQRHHPRMTRTEAVQLLDACNLAAVERGSFTIVISCPLDAVDAPSSLSDHEQPFTRQTTSMLMRSTARLVNAIDADALDVAIAGSSGEPMPSANLCDALLRMKPGDPRGVLELSCTWASALPPAERAHVPSQVQLRHGHFAAIEVIYEKLRASSTPRESLFVGTVDTLDGAPGDDGRMRGEVILSVLQEGNLKAHLDLDADDYVTALEAHRDRALVKLWGVLHRGTRVHRITNVSGFGRVDR